MSLRDSCKVSSEYSSAAASQEDISRTLSQATWRSSEMSEVSTLSVHMSCIGDISVMFMCQISMCQVDDVSSLAVKLFVRPAQVMTKW